MTLFGGVVFGTLFLFSNNPVEEETGGWLFYFNCVVAVFALCLFHFVSCRDLICSL